MYNNTATQAANAPVNLPFTEILSKKVETIHIHLDTLLSGLTDIADRNFGAQPSNPNSGGNPALPPGALNMLEAKLQSAILKLSELQDVTSRLAHI